MKVAMSQIKPENTLTKQDFESGELFICCYNEISMFPFKLKKSTDSRIQSDLYIVVSEKENVHFCYIVKISKTGFDYVKYVFGKRITGKVKFNDCVVIKTPHKL